VHVGNKKRDNYLRSWINSLKYFSMDRYIYSYYDAQYFFDSRYYLNSEGIILRTKYDKNN